jgi:plastocyanin
MQRPRILVRAGMGAGVLFALVALSAGSAAAAGPQTWTAMAGTGVATGVAANKFYPASLTIDAGDTVTWRAEGNAHTVAFLAPGQTPPDPSTPQAQSPSGGPSYDGASFYNSGIMLPLPPGVAAPPGTVASYSLTFPTAGTYQFHCLIHPGMAGTLVVQAAGTAYPQTQAQVDASAGTVKAADIATGHQLEASFTPTAATNPDGTKTYDLAAGIGKDNIEILRFISEKLDVHVGDSVVWTNLSTGEPHSVSFGTEPPPPAAEAPAGGSTYPASGWTSSGLYLGAPLPGPHSYKLTFTKAGTYKYFCVLHDVVGMVGAITVSAAAPVPTLPPTSTVGTVPASSGGTPASAALAVLAAIAGLVSIGLLRRARG